MPSPSKIKKDINYNSDNGKKIATLITNTDDKRYEFNKNNIQQILDTIKAINLNKDIFEKEKEITEEELKQNLTALNEKLHKIKTLKDTERSLFFSAIMIALDNKCIMAELEKQTKIFNEKKNGINSDENMDIDQKKIEQKKIEENCVYNLSNSIIDIIDDLIKSKIQGNSSKQKWQDQFAFIRDKDIKFEEYRELIEFICYKIYKPCWSAKKNLDLLGRAYKIFLSRAGKIDNKNIIITPDHIKNLMVELADLEVNDIVLDTCMGTGGFLMEAMEKLENLVGNDKDKKNNIHNNQLIGSEIDSKLFCLACSNMFLHGDGRSNLYDKDTLKDDITFTYYENNNKKNGFFNYIKSLKPTKCIINPPYKHNNCFDFTKQALDFLTDNGKLIIIMKENTFQKITKNIENLLKENTLDFYIKMPTNLFSEQNRSVATAIYGWTKGVAHPKDKKVKFYNLEDDGFENIPHTGRIETKGIWENKKNEILDFILRNKNIEDSNIAYEETIYNQDGTLKSIYHHFIEKEESIYIEDFEEAIFDYWLYEQEVMGGGERLQKLLKEISNRDIKKFIIRELKQWKN